MRLPWLRLVWLVKSQLNLSENNTFVLEIARFLSRSSETVVWHLKIPDRGSSRRITLARFLSLREHLQTEKLACTVHTLEIKSKKENSLIASAVPRRLKEKRLVREYPSSATLTSNISHRFHGRKCHRGRTRRTETNEVSANEVDRGERRREIFADGWKGGGSRYRNLAKRWPAARDTLAICVARFHRELRGSRHERERFIGFANNETMFQRGPATASPFLPSEFQAGFRAIFSSVFGRSSFLPVSKTRKVTRRGTGLRKFGKIEHRYELLCGYTTRAILFPLSSSFFFLFLFAFVVGKFFGKNVVGLVQCWGLSRNLYKVFWR